MIYVITNSFGKGKVFFFLKPVRSLFYSVEHWNNKFFSNSKNVFGFSSIEEAMQGIDEYKKLYRKTHEENIYITLNGEEEVDKFLIMMDIIA